jgi:LacI family transcriptional regulator
MSGVATIYDVARRARVSAATVSRVLNGRNTVDPALADRVMSAVDELGYRRNVMARNLRKKRSSLWAVIVSDVENPFFTSMVRGVEDVASEAGYSVVLCNSDEDPAKEAAYISVALGEQMAGVILSSSTDQPESVQMLIDSECPVVVIDRAIPGLDADAVQVDNEHGAQIATKHLIEQGFQRIACITGPQHLSTATQRLEGYRRALSEAGRVPDDALIRHADFRERGGHDAMASLLDLPEPPDAVFVANNLMTVGVMECLVEGGYAVPDDVALVGFDEIPWADLVRPSITTVAQPTYDEGRRAAELLVQRLADPHAPTASIVLETTLNARESSTRTG